MFAVGDRLGDHPLQPPEAGAGHEHRHDQAHFPGRVGGGAEIFDGNPVLDFRGTGAGHGKGHRPEGQRAGDETARQVGVLEQAQGHGVHRERDDEHADAAVGENRAGDDHSGHCVLHAQPVDDPARQAVGGARVLHELAEQAAQQEHQEPGGHEATLVFQAGGGGGGPSPKS